MLLALELGVAALALVVFLLGLAGGRARAREVGWVAAVGLAGLYGLSLVWDARGPLFDGAFVVDPLAVFLKQVFLLATLLAVVGGLARRDTPAAHRALEYHLLVLTSLLGMLPWPRPGSWCCCSWPSS
jgi:NADH-quinone oxidoreductase subunit N